MKAVTVAVFIVIVVVSVWARPAEDKYTDEFDNIDVEEILHSERLLNNYFTCLEKNIKCTSAGTKLRELLPDALKNNCEKCTDVQKSKSKDVLHFMAKNKPKMFLTIENIYDPEHKYRTVYAEEIKKEGVVLPPLES